MSHIVTQVFRSADLPLKGRGSRPSAQDNSIEFPHPAESFCVSADFADHDSTEWGGGLQRHDYWVQKVSDTAERPHICFWVIAMKMRNLTAMAAAAALMATGAQAATYTLAFTGPDFTSGPVTATLSTPIGPGHVGYGGGPDQLWGEETLSGYSGWLDLFVGGEAIAFEGSSTAPFDIGVNQGPPSSPGPASGLYLTSTTPMFSLAGGPPFALTFPGFTHNAGTKTFSLTNSGWNGCCAAPGAGFVDSLTITAVPEPASWALMLMGVAGMGGAMRYSRRRSLSPAVV